jgi:hypothetical protein
MKAKASGFVKYELKDEFTHLRNIDRIISELDTVSSILNEQQSIVNQVLKDVVPLFPHTDSLTSFQRNSFSSVVLAYGFHRELRKAHIVRDKFSLRIQGLNNLSV